MTRAGGRRRRDRDALGQRRLPGHRILAPGRALLTTFRGEWCVSQDKFTRDEKGYFRFYGRGDDLLKVGGRWLSPLEIENCLLSHPAVLEAAVVGFKDSDGLEKPRAFVVVRSRPERWRRPQRRAQELS